MDLQIKGRVVANLGVQRGTSKATGKEWAKATVIVETEGQYPKKIALENLKDADRFGALAVGTGGTFNIEVESREFNGRWYTSVMCWKWEAAQAPDVAPAEPYQPPMPESAAPSDDGLPF